MQGAGPRGTTRPAGPGGRGALKSLQRIAALCYKRIMREWVREKLMRRRKKQVANESESTGKVGHEIPQNQPTPLQPNYHPAAAPATVAAAVDDQPHLAAHTAVPDAAADRADSGNWHSHAIAMPEPEPAGQGSLPSLVMETQPESLAQPPAPQEPSRAPKGYVVLAIGLPGSGKTTWFKRRGVTPLSSDMLRSILFDDITEQRYQGLVFSTLRSLLRARLIAKMPWNYVDATNLSPHERRQWIKMARSFGYEVQAVFFDVPFEICMERNQRRDRMVNEETMLKMQERLRPPSFKEGFHKITVVRVKGSAPDGASPSL
jgi:predicted kinase